MRSQVLVALLLAGCAIGPPPGPDASTPRDAGRDASSRDDAGLDAAAADGGLDAGTDSGVDGGLDAGVDAGAPPDGGPFDAATSTDAATPTDAATGCGVISAGHTITLDGVGDAGEYPASQVLTPGAALGAGDTFALTWDREHLYVTVVSSAFEDGFKPLHVYLEAASALGPAARTTGKEYGGLTAVLELAATHVIAVRRTSDSGTGPYNGVYTASSGWVDRATPLEVGSGYWVSADHRTMSVRVPWTALGCPSALRLSAHVVNQTLANEWKDLVPATATPWGEGGSGGGHYEIDLSLDPATANWILRP